ncbi:Uncharacterised protein [Legionella steigerwaltii]|uniref:Uncharacterized protein n=1 Tax=Legionella steigerwaltii TaxID=460 RepID=A0A378LI80_9GAMM|nr:hypothetical protein [Legionella steigerwaltii]KTD71645.1 hypothetical protein Lstg_2853 [Legionella steigerwaltii]STY23811.1 Uncharacterised protein [Legionella steigerwaltii]
MKSDVKRVVDALKAIIDETEDFNCYLDKIEFIEDGNRLLISTQIIPENERASRDNKYALRDNFFKKYLGVPVENLTGEYAFLIPLDELSKLQIITDKINTLQKPTVQNDNSKPSVQFSRTSQHNLKKLLETLKPSKEILSRLGPQMHFIRFNSPDDVIPKGRHYIIKKIDKNIEDTTNKVLAELAAQHGLDNTLFINFTGHEAPVANALYMNGIDCIWQLSILCDETSQTRIMDQLQDSLPRDELLLLASASHDSSLGLILEPNHGFTAIDAEKLPSWDQLRAFGVKQAILLTEKNYNQGKCVHPLDKNYFKLETAFYRWLQSAPQDFNLLVIGVGNFKDTQEEHCQFIEAVFKKKDTTSLPTYTLPNLHTLFKNVPLYGPYSSPLGLNGMKQKDKEEENTNQNTPDLD